jgi:hypothetical protein
MATRDQIAAYIQKKRAAGSGFGLGLGRTPWLQDELNYLWGRGFGFEPPAASAEAVDGLASELYTDAEFRALQLATFFSSPDGKLIAEAVGLVLPLGPEYDLWVAAMQHAAQMQYTEGPKAAGRFALAITAMVVSLFVLGALVRDVQNG